MRWTGKGPVTVQFHVEDFTSRCPVTGQPDFAQLEISYEPAQFIIETKSLKLFLQRYRDRAMFNECIVDDLAYEINRQVSPRWVTVNGKFALRGGISVEARASRPCMDAIPTPDGNWLETPHEDEKE